MRIPKWVEVTEGEVPTKLSYHAPTELITRAPDPRQPAKSVRQPLGRNIITALWGNCTIKLMVGFLFLYPAFVAKADDASSGWEQIKVLGLIGVAAGIGNFVGNMLAARLKLGDPAKLVVWATVAVTSVALGTALAGTIYVAAIATLVTSGASAIAKACLDASMQDDLPEESRASAFGRSESLLQLAWVLGGATGVLVYTDLWVGFTAITAFLIPGLAQTLVSYSGASLIPGLGGNRPVVAEQEDSRAGTAAVPK
jgi:predicted MFS family arabinose efflux permease